MISSSRLAWVRGTVWASCKLRCSGKGLCRAESIVLGWLWPRRDLFLLSSFGISTLSSTEIMRLGWMMLDSM